LLFPETTRMSALEDMMMTWWRVCLGPSNAYAGAWLARRDLVMQTVFGDKLGMEYHDFYLFNQGGNGRPRVALKTEVATDFWVDHLSEYEHYVRRTGRGDVEARTRDVEDEACGGLSSSSSLSEEDEEGERRPPGGGHVVRAVVPFWGGPPETKGNAHSLATRALKLRQLNATICGIFGAFRGTTRVTVGVATDDDRRDVAGRFPRVSVRSLDVERGAYLSFALLRDAQSRLADDEAYVYFTEADQVVHRSPKVHLRAALGQHVYAAPNRCQSTNLKAAFSFNGRPYHLSQDCRNGQRVVTGDTVVPSTADHARWRGKGKSAPASTAPRLTGGPPRFWRCWDAEEKRASAFFAHASTVLKSDFSSSATPETALAKVKFARTWTTWTLRDQPASEDLT